MLTDKKVQRAFDVYDVDDATAERYGRNHILRLVLQLANGRWLVSQRGFGETPDWHVFEQPLAKVRWRELDIQKVEPGERSRAPDLSKVQSVGWTDLSTGRGSPACTRIDWIEVYGR